MSDEVLQVTQADLDLEAWFLRRMEGQCWEGRVSRLLARHRIAAEARGGARVEALEKALVRSRTILDGFRFGSGQGVSLTDEIESIDAALSADGAKS